MHLRKISVLCLAMILISGCAASRSTVSGMREVKLRDGRALRLSYAAMENAASKSDRREAELSFVLTAASGAVEAGGPVRKWHGEEYAGRPAWDLDAVEFRADPERRRFWAVDTRNRRVVAALDAESNMLSDGNPPPNWAEPAGGEVIAGRIVSDP